MTHEHGGLSVWHLTMLALGTVVGGSFFLGSAIAIKTAGPGILVSYIIGGVLVYIILSSLSEMTVARPVPGSFRTYAQQMYGPLAGFVVGWVYWTGLTLAMSSEAIAASLLIKAWFPWISLSLTAEIIVIMVTLINLIGVRKLAALESSLSAIKLSVIAIFILIAIAIIIGLIPDKPAVGPGVLSTETLFPRGISGIAGSMLIVMFAYAGFEVIGLAASEARDPNRTIPRAIALTVIGLVALYTLSVAFLLPLIPTEELGEETSPFVAGLARSGLGWAGSAINVVLIIAILSTMLAAMFGLGRMIRSLAEEGYAPPWLKENSEVPVRGILFSGTAMLVGVASGYLLPSRFYIFLVSSGGFSLLFAYVIIMATQYKFRKIHGCPPRGNCQLFGYPYTSLFGLALLIAIIVCMPLVPGQGSGLIAGLVLVVFYTAVYGIFHPLFIANSHKNVALKDSLKLNDKVESRTPPTNIPNLNFEASEELTSEKAEDKHPKQE